MPEGAVGTGDVGKEILGHHKEHAHEHHDWLLPVIEASLLAIVAVLAAWSGFSSAKWGTDSRLALAQASTARTKAGTAELAAMSQRNFDSSTFTVWFVAYVAGNAEREAIAERRFTPNFRRAFDAWMATEPATNPTLPRDRRTCLSTVSQRSPTRTSSTPPRIISTSQARTMGITPTSTSGRPRLRLLQLAALPRPPS